MKLWQIHINGQPVGATFISRDEALAHLLDPSKPLDPTGQLNGDEPNTVTIRQVAQ